MDIDPIVEEIRQNRDKYARKFNYNIREICRDIKRKQRQSGRSVVKLEPRLVKKVAVAGGRCTIINPASLRI
jgi:hypothetical protein